MARILSRDTHSGNNRIVCLRRFVHRGDDTLQPAADPFVLAFLRVVEQNIRRDFESFSRRIRRQFVVVTDIIQLRSVFIDAFFSFPKAFLVSILHV